MKYTFFTAALFLLITALPSSPLSAQSVNITPQKPHPGDSITICYQAPSDTIREVRLIFTYSNLYALPLNSAMTRVSGNTWIQRFEIPTYGIYACFYLQAGDQRIQPAANQQYEIMVYGPDGRPVQKAALYKAYSMGAQLTDRSEVIPAQLKLLEEELSRYPDNYEARLRRIALHMTMGGPELRDSLLKLGNQIVANQYNQTMPDMDALNQVTMGYLILGEKSRLDSIREVTVERFPGSGVGKELLFSKILSATEDTAAIYNRILEQIRLESPANREGMRDYHQWLFRYYLQKGKTDSALLHARQSVRGFTGPYVPVELKDIAAGLADYKLAADTGLDYAHRSMQLLDSIPVGIIRYFKHTGYIRPFVEDSLVVRARSQHRAILEAIMAQLESNLHHHKKAVQLAAAALEEDPSEEVLKRTAIVYEAAGQSKLAFENYRSVLLQNPLDTSVIALLKTAYIHWKGTDAGLSDTLGQIYLKRKLARMALLEKEALNQPAPSLKNFQFLSGRPVSVDSLKGKILVIDFWATWCIPCMHEMPYLQKVYNKFKNDKRVAFMVTNSGANNTIEDARKWKQKVEYSFPVYMHMDPNVGSVFGFNVIPALFVIDDKGMLQYKTIGFEGPSVEETLSLELELLLSKMN